MAYDASSWSDFFVAAAGASAALTGLIFVAVSINIERILELAGMPDRALVNVMQLLAVVLFSLLLLAPGQSNVALGLELIGLGVPLVGVGWQLITRALAARGPVPALERRRLLVLGGTAPFLIAGISLLVEWGGGLYWVLAGTVLGLLAGVLNAWVLLVEIRR